MELDKLLSQPMPGHGRSRRNPANPSGGVGSQPAPKKAAEARNIFVQVTDDALHRTPYGAATIYSEGPSVVSCGQHVHRTPADRSAWGRCCIHIHTTGIHRGTPYTGRAPDASGAADSQRIVPLPEPPATCAEVPGTARLSKAAASCLSQLFPLRSSPT